MPLSSPSLNLDLMHQCTVPCLSSPTSLYSRSKGHCSTMGTASTMACVAESLGMTLPQNAVVPAADSRRNLSAHLSGRRIVGMVKEGLTIDKVRGMW